MYSGSNDTTKCPMYNYSAEVIKGEPSHITINNKTGELYAKTVEMEYTLIFTICGIQSNQSGDCIKSQPTSFAVVF